MEDWFIDVAALLVTTCNQSGRGLERTMHCALTTAGIQIVRVDCCVANIPEEEPCFVVV